EDDDPVWVESFEASAEAGDTFGDGLDVGPAFGAACDLHGNRVGDRKQGLDVAKGDCGLNEVRAGGDAEEFKGGMIGDGVHHGRQQAEVSARAGDDSNAVWSGR